MKKVIRTAVDIFETFRGRSPRKIKRVDFDVPEAVAVIGHVDYIGYRTTYDGKSELYEHEFQPGSRPLMCVNADGKQLVLLGGRYVFDKNHGIVDRDHKGRKVLDPEHGKDVGFMRVRQANPAKKSKKWQEGYRWGRDGYNPPTMGNSEFAAGLAAGIAKRREIRAKKIARKENPGKLRQADVFRSIREMGLTVKRTEAGDFRVTYKIKDQAKAEAVAHYTDDLEDLLHTARAMALSTYRLHNPGKPKGRAFYGTDKTSFAYRGYLCRTARSIPKPGGDPHGWAISKDGHHIGLADDEASCRQCIDDLLD